MDSHLYRSPMTVDQVVEGSRPFAHSIDVGKYPQKTTSDPISGVSTFMLKETCAPFVRHLIDIQRVFGEI